MKNIKKLTRELYVIFALALITAYLAMSAQFESWKHPFTIMLTVPMAILGGLLESFSGWIFKCL